VAGAIGSRTDGTVGKIAATGAKTLAIAARIVVMHVTLVDAVTASKIESIGARTVEIDEKTSATVAKIVETPVANGVYAYSSWQT
jgi:hypothetical protein